MTNACLKPRRVDRPQRGRRVHGRRARRDRSAAATMRSGSTARTPLPVGHELVCTPTRWRYRMRSSAAWTPRRAVRAGPARNDGHEAAAVDVELALAADFRHMFAIRNIVELPPAPVEIEDVDGGLRFAATGSDGVRRTTTVTADTPVERVLADGTLRFSLELRPGERQDIELTFALATSDDGDSALTVPPPLRGTRVHADDELFRRMIDRSLADLSMLRSRPTERPTSPGRARYASLSRRSRRGPCACWPSGSASAWTRCTRRSPARCCTSCAAARWRRATSRRSRATTAASTPRRCSSA